MAVPPHRRAPHTRLQQGTPLAMQPSILSPEPAATPTASFNTLPSELMAKILCLACGPCIRPFLPRKHRPKSLWCFTNASTTKSLLGVSKLVRDLTIRWAVRERCLSFCKLQSLLDFLRSVDDEVVLANIRHMSIQLDVTDCANLFRLDDLRETHRQRERPFFGRGKHGFGWFVKRMGSLQLETLTLIVPSPNEIEHNAGVNGWVAEERYERIKQCLIHERRRFLAAGVEKDVQVLASQWIGFVEQLHIREDRDGRTWVCKRVVG